MKSRWTIGLGLIATLAMSVLTASNALAVRHRQPQRQLMLATPKGPLPGGADIVAASSDLTTTTVAGALKCSESVLTGKLRSIKPAQEAAAVRKATATGSEPDGGCTSPLGEADITALNLPWTLTLNRDGSGVLASASKLAFKATFPTLGGVAREYLVGGRELDRLGSLAKWKVSHDLGGFEGAHEAAQCWKGRLERQHARRRQDT